MKTEGIPLPEVISSKPHSDSKSIPLGIKLTDDEIAHGIALKLISCTFCAKGQAESVRNDVGVIWYNIKNIDDKKELAQSSSFLSSFRYSKIKTNYELVFILEHFILS